MKNNRAHLLSHIKLYASFHHHMLIQTGVTVRKRLSWVVTSVTLTFDLWPWLFARTLFWSLVITPENFMMIRCWEHSQKGVTGGQTDRRTENTIHRAAWSQLKHTRSVFGVSINSSEFAHRSLYCSVVRLLPTNYFFIHSDHFHLHFHTIRQCQLTNSWVTMVACGPIVFPKVCEYSISKSSWLQWFIRGANFKSMLIVVNG